MCCGSFIISVGAEAHRNIQFGKSRGCELAATNVKKLWVPAHLELISRVTMILIYVIEQVSSRLLMERFFSFFRPW